MSAPVTVGRDDGNWFDALCAEHGLVAAAPVQAKDLRPGHVLWTATGYPRHIRHVRPLKYSVRVDFGDGCRDYFTNGTTITLIAVRP